MYASMNILYFTLQFKDKHLLVQTIRQYDNNNKIKIAASNNYKFTSLSIARLSENSTVNE